MSTQERLHPWSDAVLDRAIYDAHIADRGEDAWRFASDLAVKAGRYADAVPDDFDERLDLIEIVVEEVVASYTEEEARSLFVALDLWVQASIEVQWNGKGLLDEIVVWALIWLGKCIVQTLLDPVVNWEAKGLDPETAAIAAVLDGRAVPTA